VSVSLCSREVEASVKAKLHDGSTTASGAHSLYSSHPARELGNGSSLRGNEFPGPSPVSLSTPGAGGCAQAELATIHAARHASASPLLAARPMSQSPPIPPDSCSSKIEIGQGTPQWKGWKLADVSPPAMKTAVRSAPHLPPSGQTLCGNESQKAAGNAPSATEKRLTPLDQRMAESTPLSNSVVSALPAKENGKEVPVEAPRSASPPPPIPDDILNYQPPSREMRAKYRLENAVALNQSKGEGDFSISDETGAALTRERRRTAQRSAMSQAPVQTPTSLLSANHSAASAGSGHARYQALVLSPEKHDLAEAAVYEAASYRLEGPGHQYATSQALKTHSETTSFMVSPILTVAPLDSPFMRNVDQGSPLLTISPGGWFGLASPNTRPCVQLPPRSPPPLPAAVTVGQRASGSARGVAVHQHGGGGSGAGGLWGSLEGGAWKRKVIFSESPHSVAARAGAKAPGKS